MNLEVVWPSAWPNKALVLTMPARGSFDIIARHNGLVVLLALFCRSGRWHGRTMQALAISLVLKSILLLSINRNNVAAMKRWIWRLYGRVHGPTQHWC